MPELKSGSHGPQRRSIRIGGYDYSQPGAYFLTACAHNRESLFGEVLQGNMRLNRLGEIVQEEWAHSGRIRDELTLDSFVVMPNHIHGIVIIDAVRRGRLVAPLIPSYPPTRSIPL